MMLWQHLCNYDPLDDTFIVAETFSVTIPASTVGSDLTDFPLFIDLSGMPAEFWAAVSATGGNIRAYDGATRLPMDIVALKPVAEDGAIFVKVPTIAAASSTVIQIVVGDDLTLEREGHGTSFGRYAMWSDYEAVILGGETFDNRAGGVVTALGDPTLLGITGTVFTMTEDPHQGIAYDPATSVWYAVDNNALYRYDATGTLLTTNSDPSGDVETDHSIGTLGHCCAPCLAGSYLVVPINNYPTENAAYLALFDKTTLAYVDSIEISTYAAISGVCYNAAENRLVACEWGGFDRLIKFSLTGSTLTFDTTVALSNVGATALNQIQDIEYWPAANCYVVSDDNRDELVRVELDGTLNSDNGFANAYLDGSGVSGNFEGVCVYNDGLAVLIDPSAANSFIQAYDFDTAGDAKFGIDLEALNARLDATGLLGGTQWTMGVTAANDRTNQSALLSYRDESSGATNDRATLALDDISGTRYLNLWDNTNRWISTSTGTLVSVATGAFVRGNAVYDGTTERKLYTNGALTVTDSGLTAKDAGYDMLSLGYEDEDLTEVLKGKLGFAYLRLEVLSADWIAAEYDMMNDNATFAVKAHVP